MYSDDLEKILNEIEHSDKYNSDFEECYYEDIIDLIITKNTNNTLGLIYELIYILRYADIPITTPFHKNLDKVFKDLFDKNNMSLKISKKIYKANTNINTST